MLFTVFNQVNRISDLQGVPDSQTPTDKLQFLDWGDFRRYILALVDRGGHLANDVDYLPAFHQQHLIKHRSDSKKDSRCVQPLT